MTRQPPKGLEAYLSWQRDTVRDRESYWKEQAGLLDWAQPFSRVLSREGASPRDWFPDGMISVADNCLLRWSRGGDADRTALCTYEDGAWRTCSYADLAQEVAGVAAALSKTIRPGQRLAVVMDGTKTSVTLLLASAWMGAVAVPLSPRLAGRALERRLVHAEAGFIYLGGSLAEEDIPKSLLDEDSGRGLVAGRPLGKIPGFSEWLAGREGAQSQGAGGLEPVAWNSDRSLLWIYANAASEMPRAAMFPVGGFLVQAAAYHLVLFGMHEQVRSGRSMVMALDPSGVAAQAHGIWGPLSRGWTVTLAPWQADKAEVLCSCPVDLKGAVLLTRPEFLDALFQVHSENPDICFGQVMSTGASLRPVTAKRCAEQLVSGPELVNNLWSQTEVGGGLVATLPSKELNRSGSLGLPLPGIEARILDDLGQVCGPNESGLLTFVPPWPALAQAVPGQEERFANLHFRLVEGLFATRDGVRVDENGFYWFMRRLDDRLVVDGVAVSTSEVEAVLAHHEQVAEAAVLPVKAAGGDRLAAFVVPTGTVADEDAFRAELRAYVRDAMGPTAVPTLIIPAAALPRTRSGKVVRRLLRRLLAGDFSEGEDLNHLANPQVVSDLARRMGRRQ